MYLGSHGNIPYSKDDLHCAFLLDHFESRVLDPQRQDQCNPGYSQQASKETQDKYESRQREDIRS